MLGEGELIFLFLLILVLFGPKHLPEIARMIGKIMNKLRNASWDFQNQIMEFKELSEPARVEADEEEAPEDKAMIEPEAETLSEQTDPSVENEQNTPAG